MAVTKLHEFVKSDTSVPHSIFSLLAGPRYTSNRSRLEREQDMGRLISELRTTPLRKVEQIRSANLLQRLDECINCNKRKGSKVEALEEEEVESSVLFSNHFQTIMLPQLSPSLTNTKNTLQSTSSLAYRLPASL